MNPADDGNVIRVVLPTLTEERHHEYVKLTKTKAEEARVPVRSTCRKAKDTLDKLKKGGEAGEDEVDRTGKSLESTTKSHVEQIDKPPASKESELLTL